MAVFAKSLRAAAAEFIEDPRGLPLIPNWNRVLAAIPEFFDLLQDAVEKDSRQLAVANGLRRSHGRTIACRTTPAARPRSFAGPTS